MSALDWAVLFGTLGAIIGYGVWKTRGARDAATYLHGGYQQRWHTIGLSVMATQASAITFLSTPGQAYQDGMRFVQFYFGLPIAMVVLSAVFVPRFYGMRVLTAYEYLEGRFDLKTRRLAALLFLLQRGLSAGITIYAPAIILSTMLGWPLRLTCLAMGGLVVAYTVGGGTRAVSQTQKHQMVVMLAGMLVAFAVIVRSLPPDLGFGHALHLAGTLGRMNLIDYSTDPNNRYTLWSGLGGGFFLALAYFGTDQSQVQRYLTARSITESRLGLLFNGLFKVPMQALILLVGVMVVVFHQFNRPPLFFNQAELARARAVPAAAAALDATEAAYRAAWARQAADVRSLVDALNGARDPEAIAAADQRVRAAQGETDALRARARGIIAGAVPRAATKDADYVFISFVMQNLPRGLVGLLLAVIICAALSSTASELSALGSCSIVDFYRRSIRPGLPDAHYVSAGRVAMVVWGALAVSFALFAAQLDNLIQAVNILGSLFYGTILGMFLVAFFARRVRATAVFVAALLSEAIVVAVFAFTGVGFLWYNVIGCAAVLLLSSLLDLLIGGERPVAAVQS
ncbi:MAG TPA: sodium:solute symporter [Polyangia bacterium]|nr:sodium:solute symporter [Polyangia bacterium]